MWLGKERLISLVLWKIHFFYFLKINFLLVIGSAFPQGNALVKLWVLELRLSGSAFLMVTRAASWAMFDLRQLHGILDRNHQEQTTYFKWRPGSPISIPRENGQARARTKPMAQGVLTAWLKTAAYTKRSMCYDFSSMGANEFPLGSSQLEMNCLSFVTRIYLLRKNNSTPMTNSTLHSGTIR